MTTIFFERELIRRFLYPPLIPTPELRPAPLSGAPSNGQYNRCRLAVYSFWVRGLCPKLGTNARVGLSLLMLGRRRLLESGGQPRLSSRSPLDHGIQTAFPVSHRKQTIGISAARLQASFHPGNSPAASFTWHVISLDPSALYSLE